MEILSEHTCQGWLEGYLLTGRHGLFSCYEAFIHIVDSMFNQHAKWLKVSRTLPWRRPVASLNYLLTSHVWRQDHNGFSHQDPGFIDHVMNKKAEVIRVYLPPDANTLLSVADHCLRSRDYVNVIVSGKQPSPDWLDMDAAVLHCTRGAGIWEWASSDGDGDEPDVVLACAGDVPTLEVLAAATDILREHLPHLRVRVVNVVDLMRLQPDTEHPHGMSDAEFNALFTTDRPVIFAYHGYPWLIHRLTYSRAGHDQLPRPRLQGGGHHDHAVRHGRDERHGPVPPGHGRHRPGSRPGQRGRVAAPADGRHPGPGTAPGSASTARTCPRSPTGPGPARSRARPRMTSVLVVNAGSSSLKLACSARRDEVTAALDHRPLGRRARITASSATSWRAQRRPRRRRPPGRARRQPVHRRQRSSTRT